MNSLDINPGLLIGFYGDHQGESRVEAPGDANINVAKANLLKTLVKTSALDAKDFGAAMVQRGRVFMAPEQKIISIPPSLPNRSIAPHITA